MPAREGLLRESTILAPHSSRAASHVVATTAVVEGAGDGFAFGPGEEATFRFTDARITVHEVLSATAPSVGVSP